MTTQPTSDEARQTSTTYQGQYDDVRAAIIEDHPDLIGLGLWDQDIDALLKALQNLGYTVTATVHSQGPDNDRTYTWLITLTGTSRRWSGR